MDAPREVGTTTTRRPMARRGRGRTALLDAAEAMVVEGATAAITLDAIAERAAVPRSSARARTDDIREVFDDLVMRLLDDHDAALTKALPDEPTALEDVAERLYDACLTHHRAVPAFRAVRASDRFTSRHESWAERRTKRMLIRVQSRTTPTNLTVDQLRLTWTVTEVLVEAAFRNDPDGDQALIDEGRALVRHSVERLLARGTDDGQELPDDAPSDQSQTRSRRQVSPSATSS